MSEQSGGNKPQQPVKIQIEVELDPDTALGSYVNMARIFHNQTEFVLDGLFLPPGSKKASVRSRLIISPMHAKHLWAALGQNIKLFEQKHGKIETPSGGTAGPILH